MEIERCSRCGLCYGVGRALRFAEKLAADGWNVFTDGDLTHGGVLGERLRSKGVISWDGKTRKFGPRDCVLIRSHGVSPERERWLNSLDCKIFDCTCPVVRSSGKLIENLAAGGNCIILFGGKKHPEIIGLAARGGRGLFVCEDENDFAGIKSQDGKPLALLCQTTANVDKFLEFATAAKKLFPTISVENTICREVALRRSELRQKLTTGKFHTLVVAGSEMSSNGRTLAEIGRAAAVETFLTESPDNIPKNLLKKTGRVLMASATSTPMEVVEAIEIAICAA